MNTHIDDLLPFYVAGALPAETVATIQDHLNTCPDCRIALQEWQQLAQHVRYEAQERIDTLPPLSPLVSAQIPSTPTQAIRASLHLIQAQGIILKRRGIISAIVIAMLLGLTVGLQSITYAVWSLVTIVPVIGILLLVLLNYVEIDSAYEIIATLPTPPITLLFARLTLFLTLVMILALGVTVCFSLFYSIPMVPLIGVWLGPVLLLSALGTALSLLWQPRIAISVMLGLWASVIGLLYAEQTVGLAIRPLGVALTQLLDPTLMFVSGQIVLAGLLWSLLWIYDDTFVRQVPA